MYYRGDYYGNYPSRIINTPNGPVTIVFVDRCHYNSGYYPYYGLGGLALASAFVWPLWFPLFWC